MNLAVTGKDNGKKVSWAGTRLFKVANTNLLLQIAIGVAAYISIFVVLLAAVSPKRYDLKVGDIATESIRAPRDVENKIATQRRMEQARQSVAPIYRLNQDVKTETVEEINRIFKEIMIVRDIANQRLKGWEEKQKTTLSQQHSLDGNEGGKAQTQQAGEADQSQGSTQGNVHDAVKVDYHQVFDREFLDQIRGRISVELSNDELLACITADESEISQLHERLLEIVINLLDLKIKEDNLLEAKNTLRNEVLTLPVSNGLRLVGTTIGLTIIKPNMVYDHEATEAERQKAAQNVERVIYKKGQYIVQDGQPVTEEQIAMLKELGLLKNEIFDVPLVVGLGFLVLLLEIAGVLYIHCFEKELIGQPVTFILITLVVGLTLGISYGMSVVDQYLMPVALSALLLTVLVKPRIAFFVNVLIAVLVGIMTRGHLGVVIAGLLGGMTGIYIAHRSQQRNGLFLAGVGASAASMLSIVGYELIVSGNWWSAVRCSLWGGGSGVLAAVLAVGTLPIWENAFGVITPIRLIELSNPNHPLLRRLLREAPGTYHHSIIVANLAESAAQAVGANGLLARVGAYYHDVGKLVRPYYFKENQLTADNPHDKLNPTLSTNIIISHTKEGIKLAQRYKIPRAIQDFILQHHGTTPVIYFYHKAKNNTKDVRLEDFRYKGPKPQTPETAIVMLADTVEAAMRTLSDPAPGKLEGLIRKLIKEKLEDGQLDECHLTLKDLDSIATAFKDVLCGIFHERIEYPDLDLKEERDERDGGGN
ncbi:putative nucleotidyltransferase with HDIG domain [Caldicoprobacter guelmensis]|uniref:HDIG domain-containing metalloprotein n=1 Tax=Caldicoprobacter guelmensis TaxID=1170224 RepID=UPI00195D129F|nr:putative nucleotidyltransferase with HDIG domain [Caldicoprobacter guelmensis]